MITTKFYKPYQYATIAAGESGRVYYYKIPDSCVGFIQQVANAWFANTKLDWIVDGEHVEPNLIERQIATIIEPKEYNPPILVRNYIEWIAYNNSTASHVFEVLTDGFLVHKKTKKTA
jgi:hypothetical protein